jgi:ribonuclease HII
MISKHLPLLSQFSSHLTEAGIDEAGRGCLAGPVVAAAVVLPKGYQNPHLRDSKKLNEKQRNALNEMIRQDCLGYGIAEVSNEEIDQLNIRNAACLAMQRAVDKLPLQPELLLIDGNFFRKHRDIDFHCIVKGDDKYLAIAAASVLAKTHRDELMKKLAITYPCYGWEKNAAYPTQKHYEAIKLHGITPLHRQSFRLF